MIVGILKASEQKKGWWVNGTIYLHNTYTLGAFYIVDVLRVRLQR